MKLHASIGAIAIALAACSQEPAPPAASIADQSAAVAPGQTSRERLAAVLEAQPEKERARYPYRHPQETLEFFGIEPGMTVVDTYPGEVWYTGILLDYLGAEGKVIGADFAPDMWARFGRFAPDPKEKETWVQDFIAKTEARRDAGDAAVGAIQYGAVPDELAGTVDVVLAIRVLHQFMRLEADGGYLTQALADMNKLLKPGGIVGVVQHRAPEDSSDAWATGEAGYVKQSAVIAAFEQAGFELVDSSELNANPNDRPTEQDIVWRLPPSLATSREDPALRAQMEAIGESDRMTLKFRKPAA
ncbi:MAG: methyltransferase [Proteobacteria bacterium]|nr:MAG: methyltransferase [Pseudomonadota bacterium]